MYVCVCVCACMCVYICMYTCICVRACLYLSFCVRQVFLCMYLIYIECALILATKNGLSAIINYKMAVSVYTSSSYQMQLNLLNTIMLNQGFKNIK